MPERQTARRSRAHPLDEFPVGYSWRVALQQRPLPLRQPRRIVQKTVGPGQALFLRWTRKRQERKTTFTLSPATDLIGRF